MSKPPNFLYPGAKTRLRESLFNYFPKVGGRYGEPFAGRGNVFWHMGKELGFSQWHLNDLVTAPWFIELREYIKSHDDHLDLPDTMNREEFEKVREGEYGASVRTLLEPEITAYGIGYARSAYINGLDKKYDSKKIFGKWAAAYNLMSARQVKITGFDFMRLPWFAEWGASDFIYADPPYYGAESTAYPDINHYELLTRLLACNCKWILSNYDNPMYREYLGDPLEVFDVAASMAEYKGVGDTRRREAIWGRL